MNTHQVTDVAAGDGFSMFVTRNKQNDETEVFGCGLNLNGELAVGYLRHIMDVTKVEGLSNYRINDKKDDPNIRVKSISCGNNHCMALLDIGAVVEWGSNLHGQLGNKKRVSAENPVVIDVRRPTEFQAGHLKNAVNIPLDFMNEHLAEFPKNQPFYMHCAGGFRSMIASSILKARGWENFIEVEGGYTAIVKTAIPKSDFITLSSEKTQ